jgi:hypothetical protein
MSVASKDKGSYTFGAKVLSRAIAGVRGASEDATRTWPLLSGKVPIYGGLHG